MQKTKILYWTSTVIFSAFFATTGTLYLLHSPLFVGRFQELGFPLYVMNIIGTAKILGILALIVPKFPRLKEWAYAGFVIDFIGAMWSHLAAPVPNLIEAVRILTPLTILTISYISYHRLQSTPESSVAK